MLHFSFRHVRNVTVGNFNGESRSEIFLGQSGLTVKENLREKRLKKGKTISRAQKIQILTFPPHATIYVDQYSKLSRRVNVLNTKTFKRGISSSSQSLIDSKNQDGGR